MDIVLLVVVLVLLLLNMLLLFVRRGAGGDGERLSAVEQSLVKSEAMLERVERGMRDELQRAREAGVAESRLAREELSNSFGDFREQVLLSFRGSDEVLRRNFADFQNHQERLSKQLSENLKQVESVIDRNLSSIREDNAKQLDEMRRTVDEKLQSTLEKRLGESFRQVSERLEQVHKGLGEMQSIASGVGDLKKVLSNVKTRGTLGEYQLGNILEQMLAPSQYAQNVATKKGSQANVEFAIRLPGRESDGEVWMPIDSKFPIENYNLLLDAYERADKVEIEKSRRDLFKSLRLFARTIHEKYIDPPHTTDFAIMFLPAEGLYAEVLRDAGLFTELQREYKITVTGPTTLAALLNSLQMGFRTLEVQKRSSEVWDVLRGVKAEFAKFGNTLELVRKQLNTATGTLDKLQTTRSNVLSRRLAAVEISVTPEKEGVELPAHNEYAPPSFEDPEQLN
jgi:DNA recombination protein RmuC